MHKQTHRTRTEISIQAEMPHIYKTFKDQEP